MNDIRRTILWVIFGFSMVLLWDQWQVYNGHKATFFPSPAKQSAVVVSPEPVGAASVPSGNPVPAAGQTAVSSNQIAGGAEAAKPEAARERLIVTTDVLKLTFDTEGGSLVQTEFLKHRDMAEKDRNFVLLDQGKERFYVAQTGLIAGAAGGALPTHKTVMKVTSVERELKDDAKDRKSVV